IQLCVDYVPNCVFGNKGGDQSWQGGVDNYRVVVYPDDAGYRGANETLPSLKREVHGVIRPALEGFFDSDAARKLAAHQVVKRAVDFVNCFFFADVMPSLNIHS